MCANLLFLFSCLWAAPYQMVTSGDLVVSIKDLKNEEGQLGILLFDQADGFPSDRERAIKEVLLPIDDQGLVKYTFSNLPFGTYAVSIMHDENKNNELDVNFIGIPKEGSGVSNNAVGFLGPPKFKKASFTLRQSKQTIQINLKY